MENFPYRPDFGAKCKPVYNTETSKFYNQTEETRLLTPNKIRTWEDLSFTTRDPVEMAAVLAFFDVVKEDVDEFTMTIEGESVIGKITKESFWHVWVTPRTYNYGFTFREIV